MFKTGYKFKETHSDIHFVKISHGEPNEEYDVNFSRDEKEARIFDSKQEAENCILNLMKNWERDDEYRWTPVIVSQQSVTNLILSKWH